MPAFLRKTISYGWWIWFLGSLFYFYQFILRSSPNAMADQLMSAFSIKAYSLGLFASCYYYSYSALQIPLGGFIDIWGGEKVLKLSSFLCTLGVLIFSQSSTLLPAALGRVLIGAGASGAFLSTAHLAKQYLNPSKFAFAVGLSIMLGKLGGMFSNIIIVSLLNYMSWRKIFFFFFIAGGVIFLLFLIPVKHKEVLEKISFKDEFHKIKQNLGFLIKNPAIWIIGIYGSLTYLPLSVFTDIWGISFLMKLYDIPKEIASRGIILVFIGTSAGAPLVALFSNKLKSRKVPMILSALFSVIVCSIVVFSETRLAASYVLLFLVGFTMTGQTLVFTAVLESVPPAMSGIALGFTNMIVMLGGAIFQPLVGLVLDFFWSGYMKDGIPVYTLEDYRFSLAVIPLCMLISFFLVCFMRETYPGKKTTSAER